ncbi:plasma membrane H+-ATPase [Sporothrix epigloea]|uniref:Plasma membrane H+-ATPase n=1 Tax=Sporothrix epigloea TaxID=1892477 RepID=A0ABP0DXW4_9PEZI
MPAPFEFPGHYWDEEKGKFFKIEATGTAPPGAQWSRQEVDAHDRRQQLVDRQQQRRDRQRQRKQQQQTQQQTQSMQAGAGGDGSPIILHKQHRHHQRRPLERARLRPDRNKSTATSSLPSPASVYAAKIRRTLARNAYPDESGEVVASRLYDRCPRFGHEVGEKGANGDRCFLSGSRSATAAAAFADGLEFKGAVPILNEYPTIQLEISNEWNEFALFLDNVPLTTRQNFPPVLSQTEISCMYVHGEDVNPGAGIVYTNYTDSVDLQGVKGQYIPVNRDGNVITDLSLSPEPARDAYIRRVAPEQVLVSHVTAICFHVSSRNLIVCSSAWQAHQFRPIPTVQVFPAEESDRVLDRETLNDDDTWHLGRQPSYRSIRDAIGPELESRPIHQVFSQCQSESVNACVASPRGYDAICIVATDTDLRAIDLLTAASMPLEDMDGDYLRGTQILHTSALNLEDDVQPRLLSAPSPTRSRSPISAFNVHYMDRQRHFGGPKFSTGSPRHNSGFTFTSVDYVHKHPRLVVAAGRHPVPWLVDLGDRSWHAFGGTTMAGRHDTSVRIDGRGRGEDNAVTHVRSAGEYHVVAASLNNKMLKYDLRYMKKPRSSREEDVATAALFRFRNYHKSSRLTGLGFDVDAELGLVAAAEEHDYYTGLGGGISLFSLATGERLHAPGLWQFSHSPERLARIYTPTEALLTVPRTPTVAVSSTLAVAGSSVEPDYHDFGLSGPNSSQTRSPNPFVSVASERDRKRYESCAKYVGTQPLPRVGALSFAALPREGTSLFVGAGARVHKFSLKHDGQDVFYGEDEEERAKR